MPLTDSHHHTHEVTNQAPPLVDYNVFEADLPLVEAVRREGGDFAVDRVRAAGATAGTAEAIEWGHEANRNEPELRTHDRFGNRIDEVHFQPAWHQTMDAYIRHETHSLPWTTDEPGASVARAAAFMCLSQAEAGAGCPISMTYSAIPALRHQPELAAEWEPRLTSPSYDPRMIPVGQKSGALCGMAMTEKQGGSDVRANTTTARPLNGGGAGAEYAITGHKWFCSAPMCDAFLVLARTDSGVSCFLLPRFTPDGNRNRFHIQRLKDKLGNRSNASSEIELSDAWARMVGGEGRGVATIIEMVNHTRLDCTLGAASGMRAGTAQAIWHASHRSAFGKRLVDQPLMENVLADLAVESEAATVAALWLARIFEEADSGDAEAQAIRRLATPVLKYWTCKRWPSHAVEALECWGGNGYVEEGPMPRLFRESPLLSIWEGSGNVQALDVLRAMVKSPEAAEAFFGEITQGADGEQVLSSFAAETRETLGDLDGIEARARRIVERMALALQGSLLVRFGDRGVADAFLASRIGGDHGGAFGTLPRGLAPGAIVERHAPRI